MKLIRYNNFFNINKNIISHKTLLEINQDEQIKIYIDYDIEKEKFKIDFENEKNEIDKKEIIKKIENNESDIKEIFEFVKKTDERKLNQVEFLIKGEKNGFVEMESQHENLSVNLKEMDGKYFVSSCKSSNDIFSIMINYYEDLIFLDIDILDKELDKEEIKNLRTFKDGEII